MSVKTKILVYGDSILKGIQINPKNNRYCIDNQIDTAMLGEKYALEIENRSRFGNTITKASAFLKKAFQNGPPCNAVVMDFGGNDCDYNWRAISDNPGGNHQPNTPVKQFIEIYTDLIKKLKAKKILPVLTTLPPLEAQRFSNWFFKGLNKENIMKWLGSIQSIYVWQEYYSSIVEKIARDTQTPIVDIRQAFLKKMRIGDFLCEDGVHPNTKGQRLITDAFCDFIPTVQIKQYI